jgi:hypothetical protein
VVVGAVKDAEILSTVALALAVLSFSSQLVIFIIQASTSTQQLRQSEELNLQTTALISQIRADIAGTKSALTDHFRELLRAVISRSLTEAEKAAVAGNEPLASQQLAELLSNLEKSVSRLTTSEDSATPTPPAPVLSEEDRRIVALMSKWPTEEESRRLLPIYEKLDQDAKGILAIAASDELRSRRKGRPGGVSPSTLDKPLVEAGLEELASTDGGDVVRLTELGRQLGRFAVAKGPRPQYLQSAPIWTYQDESRSLQQDTEQHEARALEDLRETLRNNEKQRQSHQD